MLGALDEIKVRADFGNSHLPFLRSMACWAKTERKMPRTVPRSVGSCLAIQEGRTVASEVAASSTTAASLAAIGNQG